MAASAPDAATPWVVLPASSSDGPYTFVYDPGPPASYVITYTDGNFTDPMPENDPT